MSFLQQHRDISRLGAIYLRECQVPQRDLFHIQNLIPDQPDGRDAEVQYRGVAGRWGGRTQILSDPGQTLSPGSPCQDSSSVCFLFVCWVFSYGGSIDWRGDGLSPWSLVVGFNLQLLSPPREPGGWVENSSSLTPCFHQPPSLAASQKPPHWQKLLGIERGLSCR